VRHTEPATAFPTNKQREREPREILSEVVSRAFSNKPTARGVWGVGARHRSRREGVRAGRGLVGRGWVEWVGDPSYVSSILDSNIYRTYM
jgi:hypothetical protein